MINLTNRTYKVGGYVRLSVVENEDGEESVSITNQKKCIEEFAKKNNIELCDFYIDDGYSGGNFDRPGFKRLINDIECGVINCVITKDTSRLGRDFIETGNYIYKYFPEHDVRYIAILDNFDTENPNDADDIIPFKTVVNDMYLKDTSRKIKSVRHVLMNKGLFVGSSVPYGYKRSPEDNRRFVVDEYASNIVKRIFRMKSDGMNECMIARQLTDEGILPPNMYKERKMEKTITSDLWKATSVKTILRNEVYIGTLIQGKYERVSLKSKKKKLLPRNRWIIKKNNHEPIIDKDLFNKVNNKVIKDSMSGTRVRKYDYLLKGLVVCDDCGKPMLVRRCKSQSKKRKNEIYAVYCCRTYATYRNSVCSMHYYREDDLNKLVLNEIKKHLVKYSDDSTLGEKYRLILATSNLLEKYKNDLDTAQKKLMDIGNAISELYKDKTIGLITSDEFASIRNDLAKEKQLLENKINYLKIMLSNSKDSLLEEKTKNQMIKDFLKIRNPTKQMLELLVNKITIDKNKNVRIYFNFNISGEMQYE